MQGKSTRGRLRGLTQLNCAFPTRTPHQLERAVAETHFLDCRIEVDEEHIAQGQQVRGEEKCGEQREMFLHCHR